MDLQKQNFLKNIKAPNINKIVAGAVCRGTFTYDQVMTDPAFTHNTGRAPNEDTEKLGKLIYENWYKLMQMRYRQTLTPKFKKDYPEYAGYIEAVYSEESFAPKNVEKYGFLKKLQDLGKDPDCKYHPVHMQDEFTHFQSFRYLGVGRENDGNPVDNTECRFYLNLQAKNIAKFCSEFTKRCADANLPMYFKTGFEDNRCDTVIIYSMYKKQHNEKTLRMINGIKKDMPDLFTGAEKTPQLCGVIDGNIGFGEEPTQKNNSFNNVRTKAVGEIVGEANKVIIPYLCNRIQDPSVKLQCANGKRISIQQYVEQLFFENVPNCLDKEIAEIDRKLQYPEHYKAAYGDNIINEWGKDKQEFLQMKKDIMQRNASGGVLAQAAVKTFYEEIQKGKIPHEFNIPSLRNGFGRYMHYDVGAQLREVFKGEIQQVAKPFTDPQFVNKVLSKHGISAAQFHLNENTAKEMGQSGAAAAMSTKQVQTQSAPQPQMQTQVGRQSKSPAQIVRQSKPQIAGLPDPVSYPQYDFSFDGLKNTYDTYEVVTVTKQNGKTETVAKEIKTGILHSDPMIIDRAKFARQWFAAVKNSGLSLPSLDDKTNSEYVYENYAWNDGFRNEYENLMQTVQTQLRTTGNVMPNEVVSKLQNMKTVSSRRLNTGYLFSKDVYAQATSNYFRYATPDALKQTQVTAAIQSDKQYY